MRKASLAFWGVGIAAQEASATARMPITTSPDPDRPPGFPDRPPRPTLLLNGYSQRRTRAL
jgi:hypothetical protein